MSDDYIINNLEGLEDSASELARYRQNLNVDCIKLNETIGILQTNWQNESGSDLESILLALNGIIKSLDEEIIPTLGGYVNTINNIVLETRQNQSATL